MSNRILRSVLVISNILAIASISRALMITEVMYDPAGSDTGNEWIEVYNNTDASIDITSYKLFEANTNHSINIHTLYNNKEGQSVLAGEYAVIADNVANFINLYPSYNGKLYDSAFSLNNTGELIEIKLNGNSISSYSYLPNEKSSGNGGTLNHVGESWQSYLASPGASSTLLEAIITNATSSTPESVSTTTTVAYNTGYTSGSYRLGNIRMLVPKEMDITLGALAEFFVKFVDSKDNILNANIYWSYGDGGEGEGATSSHRYYREGHYIAFVEGVTSNGYGVEKILINVKKPNVTISEVNSEYISLLNQDDEEIDIGGFMISTNQGIYKLSRKLILAPNSTTTLDSNILGYGGVLNEVKLLSAYNTLVHDYSYNLNSKLSNKSPAQVKTQSIALATKTSEKSLNVIKPKVKIYKSLLPEDKINVKQSPEPLMSSTNTFKVNTSTPIIQSSTKTVESVSSKFVKNWLYWLYD